MGLPPKLVTEHGQLLYELERLGVPRYLAQSVFWISRKDVFTRQITGWRNTKRSWDAALSLPGNSRSLIFSRSALLRRSTISVVLGEPMKKPKIIVRHYWAKTVDGEYGGLLSQLMIELLVTFIFVALMVYSFLTPGLGLFFAAFLIPTLAFLIASVSTLYAVIQDYVEQKKAKATDGDNP